MAVFVVPDALKAMVGQTGEPVVYKIEEGFPVAAFLGQLFQRSPGIRDHNEIFTGLLSLQIFHFSVKIFPKGQRFAGGA